MIHNMELICVYERFYNRLHTMSNKEILDEYLAKYEVGFIEEFVSKLKISLISWLTLNTMIWGTLIAIEKSNYIDDIITENINSLLSLLEPVYLESIIEDSLIFMPYILTAWITTYITNIKHPFENFHNKFASNTMLSIASCLSAAEMTKFVLRLMSEDFHGFQTENLEAEYANIILVITCICFSNIIRNSDPESSNI